jgi:LAO/AO transport system kinase
LGDEIQAIKAGIMEIADIFVVNKADRENANKAVIDIQSNLQLNNKESPWKPAVLKTIALTGEGVPELLDKIEEHRCFLEGDLAYKKTALRTKAEAELIEAIREKLTASFIEELKKEGRFDRLIHEIMEKKTDPAFAAEKLVRKSVRDAET